MTKATEVANTVKNTKNIAGTKEELVSEYAKELVFQWKVSGSFEEMEGCEMMIAKDVVCYMPHIYNGGWVIPGFGISAERKMQLSGKAG